MSNLQLLCTMDVALVFWMARGMKICEIDVGDCVIEGETFSGESVESRILCGGSSQPKLVNEFRGSSAAFNKGFEGSGEIYGSDSSESGKARKKLRRCEDGGRNGLQKISSGEEVKNLQNIVQMRKVNRKRQPNINCRVEAFGRVICQFDHVRKKWIVEMGFGGLLNIVGMTLPRTLCYWLMTRLNPSKGSITLSDGRECLLTPNHVRWILGLPNGGLKVPRKSDTQEMKAKVEAIKEKYGFECQGQVKKTGKLFISKGVSVNDGIIERLKGEWRCEEEAEFKRLFLLLALYMILCPTQSRSLESDLIPALTCAMDARNYDWCGLVLEKLMSSVKRFARKFDASGYAGGCGGCSLFVAIFYLDRLNRRPVDWGVWPRVQVWTAAELRKASQEDRLVAGGDFGKLETISAIYGENHPLDSGDKVAPEGDCDSVETNIAENGPQLRSRGRKRRSTIMQ